MAKPTTKPVRVPAEDMKTLVEKAGGVTAVAKASRCGYGTVYRATKGHKPEPVQVYALSLTLRRTEQEIADAIARCAGSAA